MPQPKKKEQTTRSNLKKKGTPSRTRTESKADSSAPAGLTQNEILWQHEVADLQGRNFSSVDEAIAAVIGKVIEKMPGADSEQTREFLADLFSTDPGLQDELRKLLKIG